MARGAETRDDSMRAERRPEEGRLTVVAAVALNVVIAIAKFTVAALTGSSAVLSEAIHSTVDTGDGILLWIGLRRSHKPPDALHPFGHGKELYSGRPSSRSSSRRGSGRITRS